MKSFILATLLLTSLNGESQVKLDTILLPEGVTSNYDSWLPTISIDPVFMADFAEWSLSHFMPRRCCWGRYWLRRHSSDKKQFMDKDIFELFNRQRKKPKTN